ncbi:MAG: ATP-grasp domain-containing protein, partial [Planctomycetes bacterium]|nr:ATP-grasp domain-containing protein [Planctomycetota bacterium]
MKTALLDYSVHGNPVDEASDQLLAGAFAARGVPMAIVPLHRVEPLPALPEHVVFRFDLRTDDDWAFVGATARALAAAGHRLVPDPDQLLAAEDKWHTAETFRRAGVPAPPTWLATAVPAVPTLDGPVIVKPRVGWGGRGAAVLDGRGQLAARDDLRTDRHVVQPFLDHQATWIAAVAQDSCFALLEDPGRLTGDARRPRVLAPDAAAAELALRALRATGLPCGTVDLLPGRDAVLVLEVNAAPRL